MESLKRYRICRLCLGTKSDHFEELMGIKRYMLEFIIADINLDISSDPVTCKNCLQNIQVTYEFKSICLENNVVKEGIANLELLNRIIHLGSAFNLTVKKELYKKCCFCHCEMDDASGQSESKDGILKTMLEKCLPEMDSKKSVTPCGKCLDSLKNFFTFVNHCLDTEIKIRHYCKVKKLNGVKQVDLYNVFQFFQHSSPHSHHGSNGTLHVSKGNLHKITANNSSNVFEKVICNCGKKVKQSKDVCAPKKDIKLGSDNIKSEPRFVDDDSADVIVVDCEENNRMIKTEQIDIEENELLKSEYVTKIEEDTEEAEKYAEEAEEYAEEAEEYEEEAEEYAEESEEYAEEAEEYAKEADKNIERIEASARAIEENAKEITKIIEVIDEDVEEIRENVKGTEESAKETLTSLEDIAYTPAEECFDKETFNCDQCAYKTKFERLLMKHRKTHQNQAVTDFKKCVTESGGNQGKGNSATMEKSTSDITVVVISSDDDSCNAVDPRITVERKESSSSDDDSCNAVDSRTTVEKKGSTSSDDDSCNAMDSHTTVERTTDTQKNVLKCEICGFVTKHKKYLTRHVVIHRKASKLPKFNCKFCLYKAAKRKDLDKHMKIHKKLIDAKNVVNAKADVPQKNSTQKTHGSVYSCKLCPFTTERKDFLITHKRTNHYKTLFCCSACSFVTKNKHHLKVHMKTHTVLKLRSMKCRFCSYVANDTTYLSKHLANMHKTCFGRYSCNKCTYKTASKKILSQHARQHSKATRYSPRGKNRKVTNKLR